MNLATSSDFPANPSYKTFTFSKATLFIFFSCSAFPCVPISFKRSETNRSGSSPPAISSNCSWLLLTAAILSLLCFIKAFFCSKMPPPFTEYSVLSCSSSNCDSSNCSFAPSISTSASSNTFSAVSLTERSSSSFFKSWFSAMFLLILFIILPISP